MTSHPSDVGQPAAYYVFCFAQPQQPTVMPIEIEAPDGYGPIEELVVGPVAAIACTVCADAFQDELLTRDVAWLGPRARLHDNVVRAVMQRGPVLPVKFGAVFSSRQRLEEYVRARASQIAHFLEQMADLQEWSVKVFASESAPVAAPAPEQHDGSSAGTDYLRQRSRSIGARQSFAQRLASSTMEILDSLKAFAASVRELRLQPTGVSGRDEPMLLNAAVLVAAHSIDALNRHVDDIAARYEPRGLLVELSGPWPPYSFCPALGDDR